MADEERFDRQMRIPGWKQDYLSDGIVSIIGLDWLGIETAVCSTALGIGELRLIGNNIIDDMILDVSVRGKVARELPYILKEVNPSVKIRGIPGKLANKEMKCFLEGSKVVVDTTGDPFQRDVCKNYCLRSAAGYIEANAVDGYMEISTTALNGNRTFSGTGKQDEEAATVGGGVITEEARKFLMKDSENYTNEIIRYCRFHPKRFRKTKPSTLFKTDTKDFYSARILIVGAGATENSAGRRIARLRPRTIDVMDNDRVELTNLNRQPMYRNSVGETKVGEMARFLKRISQREVNPIFERWEKNFEPEKDYDVIVGCVDNFNTRYYINNYCEKTETPYIDCGANHEAGQAAVFVPEKTPPLNYQLELKKYIEKEIHRNSCIRAPDPSVVMPGQTCGSLAANELGTVICPEKYGEPVSGRLVYNIRQDKRLLFDFKNYKYFKEEENEYKKHLLE